MSLIALNLFDIRDNNTYLEYLKLAAYELSTRDAKVLSIGRFADSLRGDIPAREVMVVVAWPSQESFDSYVNNPHLDDLHELREQATENYIWHTFDGFDNFRFLRDQA